MKEAVRKLLVTIPALTDRHRDLIRERAGQYGFRVIFCEDPEIAVQEGIEAEIMFSQFVKPVSEGKKVRWLCTPSAGVDFFVSALTGRDIILTNSSGAYGVTIAEHIVMVSLELMRRRPDYDEIVKQKIWIRDLPIRSFFGSRVVLLGTGDIGREAASRIRAFHPESITGINRRGDNPRGLFDRILTLSDAEDILPETDILISSLPSTPATKGILTEEKLRLLPETAFFVNVGRGDLVDQAALERMLREGSLGGAALDVLEKEPPEADSSLWNCPRLILTPHIAGNYTLPYTVERIVSMFLEDFENYCEGRPLKHKVSLSAGY